MLKASLSQAKYEVFDSRMAGTSTSYDQVVASMTRLAQGLTGMRAGCTLQWELLRARDEGNFGGSEAGGDEMSEDKKAELLDEMVVLERFKERVGPSLQQLSVRPPSALPSRSRSRPLTFLLCGRRQSASSRSPSSAPRSSAPRPARRHVPSYAATTPRPPSRPTSS